MIKFLSQQETQPPQNILDFLNDEFFAKINIENPVNVVLINCGWGGYCQGEKYTENNEIAINNKIIDPEKFARVYLHEFAHRLLPNLKGHPAEFFCLNSILQTRADFYNHQDAYDCQDVPSELIPTMFQIVLPLVNQLAESSKTAEQCAAEITAMNLTSITTNKYNEINNLQATVSTQKAAISNKNEKIAELEKSNFLHFWGFWLAWAALAFNFIFKFF